MAEQTTLQKLQQRIAKLDPAIEEDEAKADLLAEQVTAAEFQSVWNALRVRNAEQIIERIVTLAKSKADKLTPYAAFQQLYEDQISDHEFREAFLADRVYGKKKADGKKAESGKRKAESRKDERNAACRLTSDF